MIPSDPFRPLWPARVEYRQIELYSKKRKSPPVAEARPDTVDGQAELRALSLAFQRLDDHFFAADPLLGEGRSSWQRYLELPRRHTVDRIAAELYRILRICRIAALHQSAHREWRDGLLRLSCTFNRCALSLNLTPSGLQLLAGAVDVYLDMDRQPYSLAYHEALLLQYFFDLVGEIRKFADEDRVLYQFRQKFPYFNRHFRFDCDNPRFSHDAAQLTVELSARYRDVVRYPIDFYLHIEDQWHIVPVEALRELSLPLAELPAWRVSTPDGLLPAHFAARFSREEMIVGLPMT